MITMPNARNTRPALPRMRTSSPRLLRLGYVQLSDAAPFIIAEERGIFRKYDLHVKLERELGWATVRDKLVYGELDAAQALAPMPFSATLGMNIPYPRECVAAMTLNVNGDAITLSTRLREAGVTDPSDLRDYIRQLPTGQKLTLGVVSLHASHHILLQIWLRSLGLKPGRDVRIVVIPPPQMLRNLESGNLDGYCVGEPWNGAAVFRQSGWIAATSQTLAPNHPEKVLMLRHDFIHNTSSDCIRLIAALLEACEYCEDPASRADLIHLLSGHKQLNCPETWLHYGLAPTLPTDSPQPGHPLNTLRFYGPEVNEPTTSQATWVIDGMRDCGLLPADTRKDTLLTTSVCATDYFEAGARLKAQYASSTATPEATAPGIL